MIGRHPFGRLAFREEGELWVCHFAPVEGLDESIFLGSILMRFADDNAVRRQFVDLMTDCLSRVIKETFGEKPTWSDPEPAPEHERQRKS